MNELQPLLDETANSRLRALLEAGRADAPPDAFQRRLMVSLGVGVATAGGVSSAAAASAGQGALAPAAAAAKVGGAGSLVVVGKWVLLGACCGGALAGAAELLSEPSSPPARVVQAAATTLPRRSLPPQPLVVAEPPAPLAARREPPEPEPVRPAASSSGMGVSPAPSRHLASEVRAIDAVRRALAEGRFRDALVALEAYDRLAKPGVLAREAQVLRIEALHGSGERELARAMAERYLLQHPSDAHAPRLRVLLLPKEAR